MRNQLHNRCVKAESLVYQQRRATPYERECVVSAKPRRGDILITPLRGLGLWCIPFRRALPCAGLLKAFSLNLTAMDKKTAKYLRINSM